MATTEFAQTPLVCTLPRARHLQGDGHCRQALAFPVQDDSAPYAWQSHQHEPVHLLLEHRRGWLVLARIILPDQGLIKPEEVARTLGMVHPDLFCDPEKLGQAARQFRELWPIDIEFHTINLSDPAATLGIWMDRVWGLADLLTRFIAGLAPQPLEAIHTAALPLRPDCYNRLIRPNHAGHTAFAQALIAYPFLGHDLLNAAEHGPERQILDWIERGVPLRERLAESYRVPEETIRWLARQPVRHLASFRRQDNAALLIHLAAIPPEHRPQSMNEWRIFNALCTYTQRHMLQGLRMHWLRFFGRRGWIAGFLYLRERQIRFEQLADINDYLFELQKTANHAWQNQPDLAARHTRLQQQIGQTSPIALLMASLNWHRQILQQQGRALAELAPDQIWPTPFTQLDLGERIAVFLNNEAALAEEGRLMQHCVGTYGRQCYYGSTQIVSLRTRAGRHTATAHLALRQHGETWRYGAEELRGYQNSSPDRTDQIACEALLQHLNTPEQESGYRAVHLAAVQRQQEEKANRERRANERMAILLRTLPAAVRDAVVGVAPSLGGLTLAGGNKAMNLKRDF